MVTTDMNNRATRRMGKQSEWEIKMGLSGGYNREICIDPMYFNTDGTIVPVKPSL